MARASTRTKLPLDRWAEIIGLDPRHFNQITITEKEVHTCDTVWKQYAWQENDQVGREDVAIAIRQAEETLEHHLGYRLVPSWEVDERARTSIPGAVELFNVNAIDARGFAQHVPARWGHFISGGIEAKTFICTAEVAAPAPAPPPTCLLAYSDGDNDGYAETATVTAPTTVIDVEEIALYFTATDTGDSAGDDAWEIRPFRSVSISGGVVTIKLWTHQLVLPNLWEAFDPTAVDGDDPTNFVTEVAIYRHWNDPQQQVQLIWSPRPSSCDCGDADCADCTFATQWGCLLAKDHRIGLVHFRPATWDADEAIFNSAGFSVSRSPDRVRLWYYAGLQDNRRRWPRLQMDSSLERAVAFYSVTLLDRKLCGCNNVEKAVQKWSEELNLATGEARYEISDKWLDNPLGMTRGAVFAWQLINQQGRGIGHAVRY